MVAADGARRIDLANRPVIVLPGFIGAGQVQLGTALSPEAAALFRTRPCLVDLELLLGPREGEGSRVSGFGPDAFIDEVAIEEIIQLVGGGRALGLESNVGVLQSEVDVAPGVLMGRGGKDVRSMEVKVADSPLCGLDRLIGACFFRAKV